MLPAYARDEAARLVLRKALADDAAALQALVESDSLERAERLQKHVGRPAADALAALALAEAGDLTAALERMPAPATLAAVGATPMEQALLARQTLVWSGQILYRAGAYAEAAAYARRASAAAVAAGDVHHADVLLDFAAKLEWLRAYTPTVRAR